LDIILHISSSIMNFGPVDWGRWGENGLAALHPVIRVTTVIIDSVISTIDRHFIIVIVISIIDVFITRYYEEHLLQPEADW